jgi:hypothetical protein
MAQLVWAGTKSAGQEREARRAVIAFGITQLTSWGPIYYVFALLPGRLHAEPGANEEAEVGVSVLLFMPLGRHVTRRQAAR